MNSIVIQHACNDPAPTDAQIQQWAQHVLTYLSKTAVEICIRLVTIDEITQLNRDYREHDKATNVLAFCSDFPEYITVDYKPLGDIAICAAVVNQEAIDQDKAVAAHWAHMITHGILHLLGYDHIYAADAEIMETLETNLLLQQGYPDPYGDAYSHE